MRLGIAGVGLIGGSIALRATELGIDVVGFDTDPAVLQVARERKMAREFASTFADLAASVDTLVLAGPLEATLAQLALLCEAPPRAFPIFDVASVKAPVSRAGRDLQAFVASHPIAGSERSGPAAARADLFLDRTWTIDRAAHVAARDATRRLLEAFGADVLEIESAEHDRTIALTSHLPQLLSVALGTLVAPRLTDDSTRRLCGSGMRSLVRLGASSWPMWRAVLQANSIPLAQEVRRLAAILTDAAESLEDNRIDALAARFATAATVVAELDDTVSDRKATRLEPS